MYLITCGQQPEKRDQQQIQKNDRENRAHFCSYLKRRKKREAAKGSALSNNVGKTGLIQPWLLPPRLLPRTGSGTSERRHRYDGQDG